MGRYYSGSDSVAGPKGGAGCAGLGSGYANDEIGVRCWAMSASAIEIADTSLSYMGGFEKINWWFNTDSKCTSCCNNIQLEGPFIG